MRSKQEIEKRIVCLQEQIIRTRKEQEKHSGFLCGDVMVAILKARIDILREVLWVLKAKDEE